MLCDKAVKPAFHVFGQRVVGGAFVGKFGMAADRRNRARIEQRRPRGQSPELAVGMPQPVAELKHALPRVLAPHLIIGAEIGDVGELLAHP